MATKEDQFNMVISFNIEKVGEKTAEKFTSGSLTYSGMDYLQVTTTEAALAKFAQSLTAIGFEVASQLGFTKQEVDTAKKLVG